MGGRLGGIFSTTKISLVICCERSLAKATFSSPASGVGSRLGSLHTGTNCHIWELIGEMSPRMGNSAQSTQGSAGEKLMRVGFAPIIPAPPLLAAPRLLASLEWQKAVGWPRSDGLLTLHGTGD